MRLLLVALPGGDLLPPLSLQPASAREGDRAGRQKTDSRQTVHRQGLTMTANTYNGSLLDCRCAAIKDENRSNTMVHELAEACEHGMYVCIVHELATLVSHCPHNLVEPNRSIDRKNLPFQRRHVHRPRSWLQQRPELLDPHLHTLLGRSLVDVLRHENERELC